VFYPPGLAQTRWFNHYAGEFDTVEINNTFYRLPSEEVFDRWREQAPEGFTYAVKASRYITHVRRLKDCAEPLERFLSRARRLGDHLGPILYQLPPRWRANPERLAEFAALLPSDLLHVFEFRDERWFAAPVREVLTRHALSFCIFDMPGLRCPQWVTGPIVYIRFHGSASLYAGRYTREELAGWAQAIRRFLAEGRDVYVYFNNDAFGHAVINARELREFVQEVPRPAAPV
jgi:uncharacterized protein YecE (DUF72 family)